MVRAFTRYPRALGRHYILHRRIVEWKFRRHAQGPGLLLLDQVANTVFTRVVKGLLHLTTNSAIWGEKP